MRQLPFRLTLAAALAAAVPAFAADPNADRKAEPKAELKAETRLQKVEVKGSAESYNARKDDTATKIVVNHDEIVKFGDTNVLDVLKRLPGITVAGNGARGSEIRMRGLGSGYTQILLDGEKAPAGFSIDSLAPDTIERIEVIRAATAEYSTQSIAGTINIVLRKAVRNTQRELKLRVSANETSSVTPGMNLQLSDRVGKLAYSFSFNADAYSGASSVEDVEESFDPHGVRTVRLLHQNASDNRYLAYSASPRLTWTFANGDTLTSTTSLNASRNGGSQDYRTEAILGQVPYPLQAYERNGHFRQARTELNWIRRLDAGAKLDTKISVFENHSDFSSQRYGYEAAAPLLDVAYFGHGRERGIAFSGKYSAPLGAGHALMAGWDGGQTRRRDAVLYDQLDLLTTERILLDDASESRVRRFAVFAQDEWTITPAWSVYGGVRWEGSWSDVKGTGFDASRSNAGVFSPLFQTLFKLPGGKGDQLRFALTRTYKAPAGSLLVASRIVGINNSKMKPYFSGNPGLKPETAFGVDASYEHYWAAGAMVSASVSMREVDGYTNFVTSQEAGGRWVMRPRNDGKAHTRGLELEAKFPLKALMTNGPEVDVRANLSRNWSSVDVIPGPDNRLANQTKLAATFGADYKRGRLGMGASLSYRQDGDVRRSVTSVDTLPEVVSADLYALWKFDPQNLVRFAVGNLLQKDYRSQQTYTDASGITRQVAVYPASVGARLSFEFKY